VLLRAIVQVSLEATAFGLERVDQPAARLGQFLDLTVCLGAGGREQPLAKAAWAPPSTLIPYRVTTIEGTPTRPATAHAGPTVSTVQLPTENGRPRPPRPTAAAPPGGGR